MRRIHFFRLLYLAIILLTASSGSFAQTPGNLLQTPLPPGATITLDTTFLFEKHITGYLWGDQIMERKGLLLKQPVSLASYQAFYCVFYLPDSSYKNLPAGQAARMRALIKKGDKSVKNTSFQLDSQEDDRGLVRPYYGTAYLPCRLKVNLLYMGKLPHRVPLFADRERYDRYKAEHHGRNYTVEYLATYLVVKARYYP